MYSGSWELPSWDGKRDKLELGGLTMPRFKRELAVARVTLHEGAMALSPANEACMINVVFAPPTQACGRSLRRASRLKW